MYLVNVHAVHGHIHASDNGGHVACNLAHRYCSLNPTAHGIDAAGKSKQVEVFALLANRILSVYSCAIVVALL